MFGKYLENVRNMKPLVHCITNYVTVNDVANIILACGGSPIMSDEPSEAEEITSICNGLNINIGTLNKSSIEAMRLSGKKASELNKPILIDPVGIGASRLRTETVFELSKKFNVSVIKGNISEILTLAKGNKFTNGVDALKSDLVTEANIDNTLNLLKGFAKKEGCIVVATSEIDIVTDGERVFLAKNGCPEMEKVTGTGCQLSGMMTAFISANQNDVFEATAASVCLMGIAGELAKKNLKPYEGNSTYRNLIIDSIYNITPEILESEAKYEIR